MRQVEELLPLLIATHVLLLRRARGHEPFGSMDVGLCHQVVLAASTRLSTEDDVSTTLITPMATARSRCLRERAVRPA